MTHDPRDDLPSEEDLSAYLDGELDAEGTAGVEAALERSEALRERLAALRGVDVALRGLSDREVPADLAARLRARIARERATGRPPARRAPPRRRRVLPLSAVAALAAALLVAVLVVRSRAPVAPPAPEQPLAQHEEPVLEGVSDEDLAIALDYETLEHDLELIDRLELLERLADLDESDWG